jgi:hypothetical protein
MRTLIVLVLGLVLLGAIVVGAERAGSRPHCPTEDSCTPDYRDGRWYINGIPVTK